MVVRYGCFVGKDDYEKMAPADDGAWVKYEDHEALKSELAIAKVVIDWLRKTLEWRQNEKP